MTKQIRDLHIADLYEQIQVIDRTIQVYIQTGLDSVAISVIKQCNIKKEEFVERLNHIRKQTLSDDSQLEQIPVSKRAYIPEPSVASVVHEPVRAYGAAKDDLKLIEGIGPKIEELLNQADICTFEDLAATSVTRLRAILDAGGNRFQIHNPEPWVQQATLAAEGNWEGLKKEQNA
jgi:predicted flap endonuclease-1-like 5' DNA nuclease